MLYEVITVLADRFAIAVECHGILGKQESGHQGRRQEFRFHPLPRVQLLGRNNFV